MSSGGFIQRGGGWVAAQNALTVAVLVLGPILRGQWQNAAISIAGGVLLSVGGCLAIAGVCALGRNLTPFPKPREDSKLVQRGIYALVRHPLYSSLIFASAGWALHWRSWPALAVALALAILLDAKARREERWLRERYPEYDAYRRRVRRFLPWIY
jgi:protein-S-isoprenylcysteine O-methyltransferase Ste14